MFNLLILLTNSLSLLLLLLSNYYPGQDFRGPDGSDTVVCLFLIIPAAEK